MGVKWARQLRLRLLGVSCTADFAVEDFAEFKVRDALYFGYAMVFHGV
jgi:hypothetical protein